MSSKKKNSYIDYSYDDTFEDPLDMANESLIEKLLESGSIKSVYATKTIKAGEQFEIEIYPEFTKKESKLYKLKKINKAQRNLNDRYARKRVERLINTNFSKNDLWITLTYSNDHLPASLDEALKNIKNYIRRINYKRKKLGLEKAKYIYVTEHSKEKKIRCHHHLIMDHGLSLIHIQMCIRDRDGTLSIHLAANILNDNESIDNTLYNRIVKSASHLENVKKVSLFVDNQEIDPVQDVNGEVDNRIKM